LKTLHTTIIKAPHQTHPYADQLRQKDKPNLKGARGLDANEHLVLTRL